MNPEDLTSLLRSAATGHRERKTACPDEHQIAAYVDETLAPSDCELLELHLADCDACIALVGLLSRQRDAVIGPVPDVAVARARRFGRSGRLGESAPRRWGRYAPQWAAAAMLLVSVSAVIHFAQLQGPGVESQTTPEERAIRSKSSSTSTLRVFYPAAGATVDAGRLTFRWTKIPGTRYYDVRIVTDSGDLVAEQRLTDTEWRPARQLNLRADAEYFIHVDAYTSETGTVSSDHIPFRVSD